MAKVVLIVGCGDLGTELAKQLQSEQCEIYGVRHSNTPLPNYIHTIQADVTQLASISLINSIAPQYLIYCVAANAQTDESYKSHYVDGLRNVLQSIDQSKLEHTFFVSSTRVYGQVSNELFNENTLPIPADFGGERLLEAESLLWGLKATVLRLTGIYGPGRTRMLKMASNPATWPLQNSWTNRIHRDDAAAFIAYLIRGQKVPENCYIVTDSHPVSQHEVLVWIANQMGITHESHASSMVVSGKRLSNLRMLSTGFVLKYPDYQTGYASLLS